MPGSDQWASHQWRTISLVPLPAGWRSGYTRNPHSSSYEQDPITDLLRQHEVHWVPCPALLLQELVITTSHTRDDAGNGGNGYRQDIANHVDPRETRVMFSGTALPDTAEIDGETMVNYVGTIGPGQDPDEWVRTWRDGA